MSKPVTQPTTAQSLGALLKSARDIMRKDKGLNGDLDRLRMLTWIMFLKFLEDLYPLQMEVDALKRLQAETAVNNTGQAAAELAALLPAILDKAFKDKL